MIRGGGAGEGGEFGAVLGADDGVLVLIGCAVGGGEGVGEPVGWADEGAFGVDVLVFLELAMVLGRVRVGSYVCSLLLACAECAFVDCCGGAGARCGKLGGVGNGRVG